MIEPKLLDFATMPSLLLSQRAYLPATAGIYFAIDSLDQIQYIGRSVNIRNRWLGHHRKPELEILGNVRIAWVEIEDLTLLSQIEQMCIDYFDPPLNGLRSQDTKIKNNTSGELMTRKAVTTRFFIPLECVARLTWNKELGNKLKLLRGLVPTRELAERLKDRGISCSHKSIQQIELGEWETVSVDLIVAICEEFGGELDKLIPLLILGSNVFDSPDTKEEIIEDKPTRKMSIKEKARYLERKLAKDGQCLPFLNLGCKNSVLCSRVEYDNELKTWRQTLLNDKEEIIAIKTYDAAVKAICDFSIFPKDVHPRGDKIQFLW